MAKRGLNGQSYLWAMVLLLLLLALLGLQGVRQVIWYDELKSLYRAGDAAFGGALSPLQIWQRTSEVSNQVPGYYMLLSTWGSIVGLSNVTGRYLSLCFGLLAAAVTYRIGRDLHSPLAGLGATVALSISAFFIGYLSDMRTYTLLALLTATLFWLYWQIAIRQRRGWLLQTSFTLCAATILYCHYFSIGFIAALCLYHLLFVRKNRDWWRVTGLFAAAGLLFLPWLLFFSTTNHAYIPTARADLISTLPDNMNALLIAFSNENIALWLLVTVCAWRLRGRFTLFVIIVFVATTAIILLLTWYFGRFSARYLIEIWIPLALLIGFGVVKLSQLGLHPVLTLGVWLVVGLIFYITPQPVDLTKFLPWDTLLSTLHGRTQTGDVLALALLVEDWNGGQDEVMNYYFHDTPIKQVLIESLPAMTDADYLQRAQTAIAGADRIWETYAPDRRPWRVGMLENLFTQQGFVSCGVFTDTPALFVQLYTRPTEERTTSFGLAADYPLVGVKLIELLPRASDQTLYLTTNWTVDQAVPPDTYSVGFYLLNDDGTVAAQIDFGLPNTTFGCTTQQIDLSKLLPGLYTLGLAVYNRETGERLSLQSSSADQSADLLVLGSFQWD